VDHRVPRIGAAISIVLAIGALITFLFLNSKFEGPDPTTVLGRPFQLTVRFPDTKKLPSKQPVLYKGIAIGHVNKVTWDPESRESVVTFTLDDDFEIHQDAVMRLGERSLLGDPYLDLVTRGSDATPLLHAGGAVAKTEPSVNFDEALDFLDAKGRDAVKSLIHNVAEGVAPAGNGEQLNGTVGGVARTISELNTLTGSLQGQEPQIESLVRSGSTVVSAIGSREQAVRTIVSSGRRTLDAVAANTDSLDAGLRQLPPLLDAGRRTLAAAEPLLEAAEPVADKLSAASPDVARAFDGSRRTSVGGIVRNLNTTVNNLTPLRRQAVPVLGRAAPMLRNLENLVIFAGPSARLLQPALEYLTPRVSAISGLYALMAAAAKEKDDISHYLRVGITLDPAELFDTKPLEANCNPKTQDDKPNQGFCNNAYPGPEDALNPQPYKGPYPRILPCTPPSRDKPTKPCK
jgi:virulence factor Mce-like protein